MFTVSNADTGMSGGGSGGTLKIDLTNYALKNDTASKVDLEELETVVANKLDKEPTHHHKIAEIDELQTELNAKYMTVPASTHTMLFCPILRKYLFSRAQK